MRTQRNYVFRQMGAAPAFGIIVAMTRLAGAQCTTDGNWVTMPTPFYGTILAATTVWDPDGEGPAVNRLVVAGTNGINLWDESLWTPLGNGPNGDVTSLAVSGDNKLVAGGYFTKAGNVSASGIACWDGSLWHPLGSGLRFNYQNKTGTAYSLATLPSGDVVAGGWWFDTAGGIPVRAVARWDGVTWHSMGNGLSQPSPGYDDQANIWSLVNLPSYGMAAVGGLKYSGSAVLDEIAVWNGQSWTSVPPTGPGVNIQWPGSSAAIAAIELPGGRIVAGGYAPGLFEWTGMKWVPFGGLNGGTVYCLGIAPNGDLIAGGESLQIDSKYVGCVARWDGVSWHSMLQSNNKAGRVCSLAIYNGDVIVAGSFGPSNGLPGYSLARWRPSPQACPADVDCSGFVDTDDFTAFVLAFEAGADNADFDRSGFVDTDDFTAFVLAFEAGC